MSKLILRSERDIETLEKIISERGVISKEQPDNYIDKVVVKPWGYEFLAYENEEVAVWFLHISKGHATSMHCHPKKKTALFVLNGQALCNTFYNRNYLNAVDGVTIEAGVFHSTQALSKNGIDLIEVETPPDKTDLVRLKDQYGRSGDGYEGFSEMKIKGLERYNHFYFSTPKEGEKDFFHSDRYDVSIVSVKKGSLLGSSLDLSKGIFYCLCGGSLSDEEGINTLNIGDGVEGAFLSNFEDVITAETLVFLCFKSKE